MRIQTITILLAAGLLAAAGPAQAGERAGGPYAVVDAAGGAAGGDGAAGPYLAWQGAGEVAGVAAAAGTGTVLRHGLIGALYDIAGLALHADPATVMMRETRQVTACAELDDGTVFALDHGEPDWTIDGWPLESVSPSGLVTADAVQEDQQGTVRASFRGVTASMNLLVKRLVRGTIIKAQ